MPKYTDCPIEGCDRVCKTEKSLKWHLYSEHNKNELIEALISKMNLAADLDKKLKDRKWRHRANV